MFVVLEGEGTLRVAGEMLSLRAGDVIFIPCGPQYPHHILNTSHADLKYLSISTQERPEVCEYPDSDKIGVLTQGTTFMQRRRAGLDYWDGEPKTAPQQHSLTRRLRNSGHCKRAVTKAMRSRFILAAW
ncbi:MAG: cupin domain-containing protein [Comamonadaceae bacterium]